MFLSAPQLELDNPVKENFRLLMCVRTKINRDIPRIRFSTNVANRNDSELEYRGGCNIKVILRFALGLTIFTKLMVQHNKTSLVGPG